MMHALEAAAGLGMLAWYGSAFYVGARLLRLGLKRNNESAKWIGIYMFVAMGIGSVMLSIPLAREQLAGIPVTLLDRVLVALGFTATVIGNVAILIFTQRVFRRDSAVAKVYALAVSAMLAGGTIGHGLTTGFDRDLTAIFAVIYLAGTILTNSWASLESLRYHGLMRKRLRVGLAEPLLVNRFLLWGCASGAAALMLLWTTWEMQMLPQRSAAEIVALRRATLPPLSLLGLVCAGCYLFAFFPAAWYVRRFATAVQGG
jgi:hypothetical protein